MLMPLKSSRVLVVLLVVLVAATAFSQTNPCLIGSNAGCGDTRWPGLNPVITEPSFPALCTTVVGSNGEPAGVLYALQTAGSLNESALDTTRIQNAISACKPSQGAPAVGLELSLNPGNSAYNAFLSGPLTLQPGVTLIVDADITLFGSITASYSGQFIKVATNTGGTATQYNGGSMGYWGIMGYGVIDGQGSHWGFTGTGDGGPRLIQLGSNTASSSDYFTLYKITLQNSAIFHVYGTGNNMLVYDVKITTPANTSNTDGFDPTGSNITLTNSFISDGDDHVAIKAGSQGHVSNVTAFHNHLYAGHGFSVGSETNSGLENMLVTDLAVDNNGNFGSASKNSLRIKSDDSRGGEVKNVLYDGVCIQNGGHLFIFDAYYGQASGSGNKLYPNFHDFSMQNVNVLNNDNSGHNGASSLRGYNTAGVTYPLTMTFDNVILSASNNLTSQFLPAGAGPAAVEYGVANAAFTFGPDPVSIDNQLTSLVGSFNDVSVTNNENDSNPPYDCTNKYTYLAGELFTTTSTIQANNSLTLRAIVQPTVATTYNSGQFTAPAPNGTLTFFDNGSQIGTEGVSGRITNFVVSGVTAGQHIYTVQYSGDTNYISATPICSGFVCGAAPAFPSVTVTALSGTPTTTAVSPSPSSLVYGNPVIYTATVTPNSGSGTPTGTVTFTDGSVTSQPQTLSSGSASWTNPLPVAGTHTVTAVYSGDSNFLGSSGMNSTLSVSQVTLTASVTAANKVYDGGATATLTGCTLAGVILADTGKVTCSAAAAAFAPYNVGSGITVTATGITLGGSAAGNYTLLSTQATTTANITTASPAVTVNCPAANYDTTAHGCTALARGVTADGDISSQGTFSWSPAQNETNAGSYPITATFNISSNPNYSTGAQGTSSLVIAAATPAVTVTCPGATYDGSAHGCTATATGVGSDGNISGQGTFSWSPAATETNAGSYTLTATFAVSGNYVTGVQGSNSLVIAKASVAPSVTAANKVYDGTLTEPTSSVTCSLAPAVSNLTCTAAAATFASANVAPGISVTATGITLGGTAAPNYALSATQAATTANITQATPTINLNCPAPVTYDTNPHSCTATATGVGGATVTGTMVITYNGSTTPPSAKGTYAVVATFTSGDPNYNNGTPADGTLSIVAAVPVVTVTCPAHIYDSSPHGCTATVAAGGTDITSQGTLGWSPAATETNAGTYPMTATFTPTDTTDYGTGSQGQGSLVISPATPTVTVNCPGVTYDGSAHGCTATATGVGSDGNISGQGTFSWSPAATETNAGSYTLTATFAVSGNYVTGVQGSNSLVIAKASVAPSVTAASKVYDGTLTEPTSSVTCSLAPAVSNLNCTVAAAAFTAANVNTGITVTATGITLGGTAAPNYVLSATQAATTANITQATPTVTVVCPGVTFDGNPHSCTAAATGAGNPAVTGSWVVTYNGSTTAPTVKGTYPVVATFTSGDPNYTSGTPANGSLVIAPATPTVVVTCPTGITFDGNTHSCSAVATGVGSDGNITSQGSFGWSPAQGESNAGSYTITATFTSTNPNYNSSGSGSAALAIAALVPAITGLSPAEQAANAAAFTLTVNGANFLNGATVNWNGSPRTTTFVSATQLTAAITVADLTKVGTASVTVTNAVVAGSAASGAFKFAIDTATGTTGAVTVSATSATITVAHGQSTTVAVSLAGANANATVTANCVNLPAGVTCGAYSNGSVPVTTSASAVPGNYQFTVIFTVAQPETATASAAHGPMFFGAWSGLLGLPLGLLWAGGSRRKGLRRVLLTLVGLVLLATLVGCGGKAASPTVTSQSSVAVSLTVQ
jgi:hypothetical protein